MGHPDGDWGSLITMENRKPKKKIGARKKNTRKSSFLPTKKQTAENKNTQKNNPNFVRKTSHGQIIRAETGQYPAQEKFPSTKNKIK